MGAATGWAKSSSAKPSGRRCAVGPVKGFLPGAILLVVGCWLWLWFLLYHILLALWFLPGGMVFVECRWVLSGGWRMFFLVSPSNWWITPRQCSWSYVWFPAIVILLENIPHHFGIWDAGCIQTCIWLRLRGRLPVQDFLHQQCSSSFSSDLTGLYPVQPKDAQGPELLQSNSQFFALQIALIIHKDITDLYQSRKEKKYNFNT